MAKKKSAKLHKKSIIRLPKLRKSRVTINPVQQTIINELAPAVEIYTCPTTDVAYATSCPVLSCPANVSKLNRKSGCAYNFLDGKQGLTAIELSYVYKLDLKTTKQLIEEGEEAIQRVLLLNKLLARARENTKVVNYCKRCGVLRTSYGDCINTIKCDERFNIISPLLERYPFNLAELNFQRQDMIILLHNRSKINAFLKTFDKPNRKIRFSTILNINNAELNQLRTLSTLV